MAGNPLIAQGTLSRIRASVLFNSFPQLNVTAPFLGEEGISLRLNGPSTTRINTMTGTVTSLEPYIPTVLTIGLLKTQFLSDLFKQQMETLSTIGDCVVRPDSRVLSPYPLYNCSIDDVNELSFNGKSAGWIVTVGGYYLVNSAAWN